MSGPSDSGGIPFHGRELSDPGFAGDTGEADPALVTALGRMLMEETTEAVQEALRALRSARVLVPVVATPPGETVQHHGGAHGQGEASDGHDHGSVPSDGTEMATVTLTASDGSRALPVFTGVRALAAWDPDARPSPTHVPDVARSAIEDGCDTMLVDLGSPHAVALPLSHVWALAQERDWLPAHEDPVVLEAVAAAADGIEGLTDVRVEDGSVRYGPGVLRLVLVLRPGLDRAQAEGIATTLGQSLAADPEVRIRIDDVTVALSGT